MKRILLIALLVGCTSTQPAVDDQPFFDFHSNFWLNLHHFLRVVGRGEPIDANLTADERAAWDAAVTVYRTTYSQRDLLFDREMVAIKNALRGAGESLDGIDIPADLRTALITAAPVYRRHFWPAHDAANRAWIANAESLVRQHGAKIAAKVAAPYGETWPTEAIDIDLSVSAGPVGAYTTYPPHATISSMDKGNQGIHSLEIVFHETTHQWGRRLSEIIRESATKRGKTVPRDLWHAVLFYNSGEVIRRVLADAGVPYTLYGHPGVYTDLCGAGCYEKVKAAWDARLDGRATMEEALDGLVAGF
jgi:hypothetical protein